MNTAMLSSNNPVASFCTGKARFASIELASGVAQRRRRTKHHLHPYRCPACRMWHLSGRKKRGA